MVTLASHTLEYAPPELAPQTLKGRAASKPGVKEALRLLERHGLHEAVEKGTATPEQVQALLSLPEAKALPKEGHALLLFAVGVAFGVKGHTEEALAAYTRATELAPENSAAWFNRGVALGILGQHQEALASFEKAYTHRLHLEEKDVVLFRGAAAASVFLGVSGITKRWLPDLETATRAYIKWRERARRNKQLQAFREAVQELEESLSEENREAFEEFQPSVRLLSIRDPFKGWKALAREVSKVWPRDVSAVDAIREQRRW